MAIEVNSLEATLKEIDLLMVLEKYTNTANIILPLLATADLAKNNFTRLYLQIQLAHCYINDKSSGEGYNLLESLKSKIDQDKLLIVHRDKTLAGYYALKHKQDKSISLLKGALSTLKSIPRDYPRLKARIHTAIGYNYWNKREITKAFKHHRAAIEIYSSSLKEDHPEFINAYNHLAQTHGINGEHLKKIEILKKVIKLSEKAEVPFHGLHALAYNNMAYAHSMLGDKDSYLKYLLKSLEINKKFLEPGHTNLGYNYNNLGNCYVYRNDFELGKSYFLKAQKVWYGCYTESHSLSALTNQNLGWVYRKMGDYDKGIPYYIKAIDTYRELKHISSLIKAVRGLAEAYEAAGKYEEAECSYKEQIDLSLELYSKHHFRRALAHNYYGIFLLEQKRYQECIEQLDMAIPIYSGKYSNNPFLVKQNNLYNLFTSTKCKAQALKYLYKEEESHSKFILALGHFTGAIAVLKDMRNSYKSDDSKLLLTENTAKVFTNTLDLFFDKKAEFITIPEIDISQIAFNIFEQNTSFLLQSNAQEHEAKLEGRVPTTFLKSEMQLKKKLIKVEQEISKAKEQKNAEISQKELELQGLFIDLRKEYDSLIEKLEEDYPRYYKLKYYDKTLEFRKVQKVLSETQLLIQFSISADYIYACVLSSKTIKFHQIVKDKDLEGNIDTFNKIILNQNKKHFSDAAFDIYSGLILPLELDKYPNHNRITWIADGALSKLPFDLLLDKKAEDNIPYRDYSFLLKKYEMSSHFSTSLWFKDYSERILNQNFKDWSYLGIATMEYNNENTINLSYTKQEVLQAEKLLHGKKGKSLLLLDEAVSLKRVKQELENSTYSIIHFATHGYLNDEKPSLSGILFPSDTAEREKQVLHISDTYTLDLNTCKLAILNFCESGIGRISKGEGILGIHRGFYFAGARNILYSLLKIDDKSSRLFIANFITDFLLSQDFIASLRHAKLQMIKENLSPLHWGAYTLISS